GHSPRHLDELRNVLRRSHAAGALEERALFDPEHRRVNLRRHARPRMDLDALAREDRAFEGSVDRDALDPDLRVDLGGSADYQLPSRRDLPIEPSIDPEGLLEGQLALQVASLVEKSVERGAVAAGLHVSFLRGCSGAAHRPSPLPPLPRGEGWLCFI